MLDIRKQSSLGKTVYCKTRCNFHGEIFALFRFLLFGEGRMKGQRADMEGRGDEWIGVHDVKVTKNQ